ncbi:glycosyltransferase family 9 protein, partial [Candidatus Woesearchaeota archaeon]|nr:glycosyltransferase family 9 protein [Candidatus Woesearchaeota archaeon]
GIEPAGVVETDKRNRIPLRLEAHEQIANLLRPITGPRILFNHKASVPLRTCPESAAISIIMSMLVADPSLQIILSSPLPFSHPRVHDMHEPLKAGTDRFNSLVAQVDGIVSVDTYSVHAADAFNIPLVGLYASVSPDSYPYYPLHHGILIPGGENLPAFRKSKIADEEEWKKIQPAYEAAWHKLTAPQILAALQARKQERHRHSAVLPRFLSGPHRPELFTHKTHGRQLRHDRVTSAWERAVVRQVEVSKQLVRAGGTAIVIAPGQSRFAISLADQIGPEGKLYLFEPRPYRQTLIAMDLLEKVPQTPVVWHQTLPAPAKNIDLAIEEPLSETTPLLWGSSRINRRLPALPIDALELPFLSAIFMFTPMIFRVAIQSARATLLRTKASLVCGPIEKIDDIRSLAEDLQALRYQCWVDYIEGKPDGAMLLVAVPDHLNVQAAGMKKVVVR